MSATNYFETAILELIFNGTTIANIADNAGTSPATTLYISLHTADPGESGSQDTSEATYTSYARVGVARTSGAWSVSGDEVTNVANIAFPQATGGTETVTHFGVGLSASGPGTLLFKGPLNNSLNVSNGIAPLYQPGTLIVDVD